MMSSLRRWIGLSVLLLGCGARVEDDEAAIGRTQQALPGPSTLSISIPKNASLHQLAVAAKEKFNLGDRFAFEAAAATFPGASSVGTGSSRVGSNGGLGNVWSQGTLTVASQTQVHGSVHAAGSATAGTLVVSPTAVIDGVIEEGATLQPPHDFAFTINFVANSTPVPLEPGTSRPIAPGAYGAVSVKAGATLSIRSGTYYFSSLYIAPQGTLALDTRQGPIYVYVASSFTQAGVLRYTGDDSSALFGYFGTQAAALQGPFTGTLVAPSAEIILGPGRDPAHPSDLRGRFKGAYYGLRVTLQPDSTINYAPFKNWDLIFPTKPIAKCVTKVGNGRYAALFGYDNPLDIPVTIPKGALNSLSGVMSGVTVEPLTTFAPGSNPNALWVPFTSSASWTLRGVTATATPTSPECPGSVFGASAPTLNKDAEGPSYNVAPSTPKAGDFSAAHAPLTVGELAGLMDAAPLTLGARDAKASNVRQRIVTALGSLPFTFRVTQAMVGDDGVFEAPDLQIKVSLDGGPQSGWVDLGPCDGTPPIGTGCIYSSQFAVNEVFTENIPADQKFVHVHVEMQDVDIGPNDDVGSFDLDINNQDGTWSGSVNSPTNCFSNDGWGVCWAVETTAPPEVNYDVTMCTSWNASFVDEGQGETRVGTPVSGQSYKTYPASFATTNVLVKGPLTLSPSNVVLFPGTADAAGCVKVPAQALVHATDTAPISGAGLKLGVQTETSFQAGGVGYMVRDRLTGSKVESWAVGSVGSGSNINGTIDLNTGWTTTGFWKTPPTRIDVVATGHTPMSNVAAVISTILTAPDNGIVDGNYEVLVNDGLLLPDNNVDSVAGEDLLSVGPPHTPSPTQVCKTSADCPSIQECMDRPDCSTLSSDACRYSNSPCSGTDCICRWPHQARWKYVVTHEAGHQIQGRASGSWAATDYGFLCPPGSTCPGSKSQYTKDGVVDPPWTTDLCGCEHVNSANREHCLQSIERSASAQVEGIGQFYGSRTWNRDDSPECKFVYYKEFLDTTCRNVNAGPGDCIPYTARDGKVYTSTLPPAAVDCGPQVRWRNKQGCNIAAGSSGTAGDYGTEYDWMTFLYNMNRPQTAGATTVLTSDIWNLYRHVCNPPPPGTPPVPVPAKCGGSERIVWDALSTNEVVGGVVPRGFRQGIEAKYSTSPIAIANLLSLGTAQGISGDTTPPP